MPIGELMMKVVVEYLWKFDELLNFGQNGICPINIIWDVFWVWKDQNWSVWEKMFWNLKFFFLNTWVFA